MIDLLCQRSSKSANLLRTGISAILPLQTDLNQYSPMLVSWGVERLTALNGGPRIDGLSQLEMFQEVGLNTPTYIIELETAINLAEKGNLVFSRKLFHSQGKDILSPIQRKWENGDYWVCLLPNFESEWRFHIFMDKSIHKQIKVKVEDAPYSLIRNRETGWRFQRRIGDAYSKDQIEEMRVIAKKAVVSLGYDFGAVDLFRDTDNNISVLEVNKAPGLDVKSATYYAKAIINEFKRRNS